MSRSGKSSVVGEGQATDAQVRALEAWLGVSLTRDLVDVIEPAYSLADWFRLTTFLAAYRRGHQGGA